MSSSPSTRCCILSIILGFASPLPAVAQETRTDTAAHAVVGSREQGADGKRCPPAIDVMGDTSEPGSWRDVTDQRVLSSFIGISECWSADVTNDDQKYLNDLYTTLVVDRIPPPRGDAEWKVGENPPPGFVRDYKSERRNRIARLITGKSTSLLVSTRIHIRDPDVDFTVPLLSIDYNGRTGQAESFVTNLTRSDMAQPFFRLTPNSSIQVAVDARSSVDMDVNAGGAVIGTLKDALALAAPGSSLVTTVNSAQLNKIASTFDAGLSKLWSNSISESTTSGKLISEWYPHAAIYVSVDLPDDVRTFDGRQPNADDPRTRGLGGRYARRTLWFRIQLSCPRLSIFDSTNICELMNREEPPTQALARSPYRARTGREKPDPTMVVGLDLSGAPGHGSPAYRRFVADLRDRVEAHQVLNYNLEAGRTIRQFITSQDWFATLTTTFASGKSASLPSGGGAVPSGPSAPEASRIGEFCESVVERLYNAGLSDLDSKVALWALADGLPDFVEYKGRFGDPTCVAHMPAGWRVGDGAPQAQAAPAKSGSARPSGRVAAHHGQHS